MATKTFHVPVIAMLDEEFIDTGEIAHVSKVSQIEDFEGKKNEFWFAVMLKGHSNKLFYGSDSEVICSMKRAWLVELWHGTNIEEIEMFDEEQARAIEKRSDKEGPNYDLPEEEE